MRTETRTGILVVAKSGSEGHRKVHHILMIPRTIHVSRHRRVAMTHDHWREKGTRGGGSTRKTTPEKQSSYQVDAFFDNFGSVDMYRVRTRACFTRA